MEWVPPQSLVMCPQIRQRILPQELDGLAQSIREVGILHPIITRPDKDQQVVVDGHRRTLAALKLGLPSVPILNVDKAQSAAETIQIQLVANCQRADLSPIDKAVAIQSLMADSGWTATEVASRLGFSAAAVTKLLTILNLPEAVRQGVAAGKVPASAAYELAQINDPAQQADLANQLLNGRITRDELAGVRKARRTTRSKPMEAKVGRAVALLGEGRSVTVSGTSLTLDGFVAALEDLLTRARRERTRGVELSTFLKLLRDQARLPSQPVKE